MTKEAYLEKRQELLNSAQASLDAGNVEESNEFVAEVEELDKQFEETAKAQADLNAMAKAGVNTPVPEPLMQNGAAELEQVQVVNNEQREQELYRQAFAKKLLKREMSADERQVFDHINVGEAKMAANTAADHGVVVPDTVSDNIWQEAGELHPILDDVPFTSVKGTVEYITETAVSDDAKWVTETEEATDSALHLGKISLSGCELIKAIPVTRKLQTMSIDTFLSYITSQLAERMGAALANAIVSGTGPSSATSTASQPEGIITSLKKDNDKLAEHIVQYAIKDADSGKGMAYKDITSALALIKSAYIPGVKIYAKNSDIWNILANLVDGQKRPIFIPDVTGQTIGRLFGRNVIEEDAIPAGSFLFGNVNKGYVANFNESLAIDQEYHAKGHYTDYVAYSLVDGAVRTKNAFALVCPTIS